jgi:hypothetical protein
VRRSVGAMSASPTRPALEQELLELDDDLCDLRERIDDVRAAAGLAVDVAGDLADRVNAAGEQVQRVARRVAALVDEQPAG